MSITAAPAHVETTHRRSARLLAAVTAATAVVACTTTEATESPAHNIPVPCGYWCFDRLTAAEWPADATPVPCGYWCFDTELIAHR
jgi:hypothetical protein